MFARRRRGLASIRLLLRPISIERLGEFGAGTRGGTVLFLDSVVDFAPQDRNGRREREAKLHGLAADLDNGEFDIVVYDDGFADLAREVKHFPTWLVPSIGCRPHPDWRGFALMADQQELNHVFADLIAGQFNLLKVLYYSMPYGCMTRRRFGR